MCSRVPRNARVAELVGIQNHFRRTIPQAGSPAGRRLDWGPGGAVSLRVLDKNRIPDGAAVTWVIAGERIDLLADGAPQGNILRCKIAGAAGAG